MKIRVERGTVVKTYEGLPGLSQAQNLRLRATEYAYDMGWTLYSMSFYTGTDSLRLYPYRIEYTRGGNVKYAGQVKSDGTNPDYATLWVTE